MSRTGKDVTLLARRELWVQVYDVADEYINRERGVHMAHFYGSDAEERASIVRRARGQGRGTVTPYVFDAVGRAVTSKRVRLLEHVTIERLCDQGVHLSSGAFLPASLVVLATGRENDCLKCHLFRQIREHIANFPVVDGMPVLDDSLRLCGEHDIFVVGALAALGAGPDAHNLSGTAHCSARVVDALLAKRDLRLKSVHRLNRFDVFDSLDDD
jgi:hypothetical protein